MHEAKKILTSEIGSRIRNIRTKKGLSMNQLAIEADIEYKQLSRIELGEINTSVYQLYKISKALEVPLNKILSDIN
ncbi:MAG: helix-turn-helix domain-containing protein [Flavobacterium sp.]|nr:helix-turn-helix domain-containing protein [Flavobacterium sp.]